MAKKRGKATRLTGPIGNARAVPIGDYGFLRDGEVSALLAPRGAGLAAARHRRAHRACPIA